MTTFTKKKNNAHSTLLSTHTSGDGTIVIQSGEQGRFPATFPFKITVWQDGLDQLTGTIFTVVSAAANTFTVTVASDESPTSVDQTFTVSSGTFNVACEWTYGASTEIEAAINAQETAFSTLLSELVGTIMMYGAASAPTGWLLCDGSAVSRSTYANLFAIVSTTFGVGNGTTTFNLPDLRGKFPLGVSGSHALAATGGSETVNLQHSHTVNSHTHQVSELDLHNSQYSGSTFGYHAGDSGTPKTFQTGGSTPGTDNQLSTTQSVLNPYLSLSYIIKT